MQPLLIIGGGIGGLSAAIALRQRGFDAHVYEAAATLAPVGKGITVPLNALLVLDRMGVGANVAASGVAIEHASVHDLDSGLLQHLDLSGVHRRWNRGSIALQRSALQEVLLAALPAEVVHLGKRLAEIVQDGDTVTARFADGTSATGCVLVGADGVHSAVRGTVAPDARLRDAHQTCYLGLAPFRLPDALRHTAREVWGGAARFGFAPVAPDLVYWFAPLSTDHHAVPGSADDLRARYASFPDPIPALIAATPFSALTRTELRDLLPLPRWSQGRVVLLGDAAHAMTPNLGQGGAQSIEDAEALADALAAHPHVHAAFAHYERARRARVQRITATSFVLGRLAHTRSPWLRAVRNGLLRATPDWVNRRQLDRLVAPVS